VPLPRLHKDPTGAVFVKRFALELVSALFGGPQLIISFFQHSLIFNISLTFYYSSNKKIITKQNFSSFYTKHSYFFTFSKKKHSYFFSYQIQCKTKTKPKSFTKRTLGIHQDPNETRLGLDLDTTGTQQELRKPKTPP
jgi:hypothetical protein